MDSPVQVERGPNVSESLLLEDKIGRERGGENPGRFLRLGARLLALSHSFPPGFTCARQPHYPLHHTPGHAGTLRRPCGRAGLLEPASLVYAPCRPARSQISESR